MTSKNYGYPALVLSIVALGLFSLGAAHADPQQPIPVKAVIKGPSQVLAGTLLFLSSENSSGDNSKWLIPQELEQSSAVCGSNIFFAIPKPGQYSFGLVVANKAAEIDVTYHKVMVTSLNGGQPPPEEPQPPTEPDQSFDILIKKSKEAVMILSDPTTANALKTVLVKIINDSGTKSLEELRKETVKATQETFLARKGDSLKKDWGKIWAEPIDALIVELSPKDSKTYVNLLKALASTF